jgi:hypothetical protein
MRQSLGEARAIITDPGCFVLEDALATSSSEGIALEIEVLILGRDASITNQHVVTSSVENSLKGRRSNIVFTTHVSHTKNCGFPGVRSGTDRVCG